MTDTVNTKEIVEIESTLDALYEELHNYEWYGFDYAERDNNGRATFVYDMFVKKMKRCGYKITFYNGKCEFSILDSVCKVEREVSDDSCGIENASYKFTLHFTGSEVPLIFYAGKFMHLN